MMEKRGELNKKAQITLFIIMGLIIILFISVFIYLQQTTTIFEPEKIMPAEFVPVKRFVEKCTETLAEDAVFLASMQAGYVEIPDEINYEPLSYVDHGFKVPLWLYNGQDCMPTRKEIEGNIASYINSNLKTCLNGFEEFSREFDIEELGEPSTAVSVNDYGVFVKTDYPLKIQNKLGTEITEWKEYATSFANSLGRKYKLASAIMKYENNHAFLENITMEIIAASDLPHEGLELTCSKRKYNINEDIIPDLKLMLLSNLRYLTFENTDMEEPPLEYHKKLFRFGVSKDKFPNMQVTTTFNRNSELSLDVYPNKNGVVEPLNVNMPGLGNCFKVYNHKYDIIYPLVFQITDTETSDYFFFATPVIIDRSEPSRKFGIRTKLIDDTIRIKEYCDSRDFGLTVYAVNEFTNEYLNNVSVKFQCVRFLCEMGRTGVKLTEDGLVIDPTGFVLETDFPSCVGGIIIAEKEGYVTGIADNIMTGEVTIEGQTELYEGEQVNVYLTPLKTIDFKIRVIEFDEYSQKVRVLNDNETVVIMLSNDEKDYRETIVYPFEHSPNNLTIMVSDYSYSADIKLMESMNLIGGFKGNWTMTGNEVYGAEKVVFYVVRNKRAPGFLPDYKEVIDLIEQESENHMPRLV